MTLAKVGIDDKFDLAAERVYISGTQTIVRLAMMQQAADAARGLNTAGYVTGYRGSPLGGVDQTFLRAAKYTKPHNIVFQPGLNEDLAATALWGAQQAELRGEGAYDGVFGIWYGKGPGVDRSGDVFRHANHAGTSRNGGVLALMGDDHTCESSTSAHQSEFAFVDAMMPVLNPANVQEILDYGLYGIALSRFAGVWVGLKCVKDNIEQTAIIDGRAGRVNPVIPSDFPMPPGGLNLRVNDTALAKEARLHDHKLPAVLAFLRANKLDRMVLSGGRAPKIGIVTTGKSYQDVAEALDFLGIDEVTAANYGLRLYKLAMTWPVEPEGIRRFAEGLDLIMVVEEKRALIETQLKEQLYGLANAPAIIGKRDEKGDWLLPAKGALEPVQIALALARRIAVQGHAAAMASKIEELEAADRHARAAQSVAERIPYFCAGCPHNSSTVVPEGARAYAGIGCHYMVQWMDRATEGFTHMGGEGANWIGEAPFSTRRHVFQNIGDGTFIHSGSLAVRAAVASGVNMTVKLLYNDAVAMTGGQALDGAMTVSQMAHALAAEGVKRIAIVSDQPEKYSAGQFPAGAAIAHRDDIDPVQRSLSETAGVTALIYDQTCAAEKRRRRKRGTFPNPDKRVLINELVCEGCGDCGVQSNCVAIEPVETEFGRKRAIDQDACNKDFSCIKGFCPSFVTVHGGQRRKAERQSGPDAAAFADPAEPAMPSLDRPYSMVMTGVGGTGVVTVGAVLGMAAHLEGKGAGIIDMSGLAQKGGPVAVHVRIAERPEDINAIRASSAGADLVVGGDLLVAGSGKVLSVVRAGRTRIVASPHETMTGDFTRTPDFSLPAVALRRALEDRAGAGACNFIDAQSYAAALTGDKAMANILLLGFAYQKGLLPLSAEAINEAIQLNGVAIGANQQAFRWGRLLAIDEAPIAALVAKRAKPIEGESLSRTLDEAIARRVRFLTAYQDAAYAELYRSRVEAIRAREAKLAPGSEALTLAVAKNLFKLMAYKDEYEVARLYTDGSFQRQLAREFEGDYKLEFHLAPPLFSKPDPETGRPRKLRFGGWMMTGFRLLARMKGLRGSRWDVFGYNAERRQERQLIADYEAMLDEIAQLLRPETLAAATALASVPEQIRGYGPVKAAAIEKARLRQRELRDALHGPQPVNRRAA
ncbi:MULTISPECIES: indolepyruvate ferredoxin oxidoreductase family protein [Rhodomicrobium]|uniref:indolepyruvate ferredoxin oxidoreductase family protein n=1 Tax=Rhodomicrobium TaxID=1068 RepID=UPI000B4B6AFB|nr:MULTISPECIES: indolepyruvate ferredoxin oxidoreductase family protein [Rhodomicrobium]